MQTSATTPITLIIHKPTQVSKQPAPSATVPPDPQKKSCHVKRGLHWLNHKSQPQADTLGDFDGPAYFQAGFQGAVEGYVLRGPAGSLSSAAASLAGVFIEDKTGNNVLAVVTGIGVGAGLAIATSWGAPTALMTTNLITGGLLGAFQTYRGNQKSRVRDSGGNAAMLAGAVLHGPGKVAAGIASAVAERYGPADRPGVKAAIGGVLGIGLGVGMSAIGYSPIGMIATAGACGAAGALGPSFGPRFSQFFRNFSKDMGEGAETAMLKTGMIDKPLNPRVRNCIGAIPSSFIKEGTRDVIYGDGNLVGMLLGGVAESIQQADIFLHADHSQDTPTTPPPASAPSSKVVEQPKATDAIKALIV